MSGIEAAVTICSKDKLKDAGFVEARLLYTGPHIRWVEQKAASRSRSFFILSGVHGLVRAKQLLKHYDHHLDENEERSLASKLISQFTLHNITSVEFYFEDKPDWVIYQRALRKACQRAHVELAEHEIDYR